MVVSINDLCRVKFARRNPIQQRNIVGRGRPLPLKHFSEASASNDIQTPITPRLFEQVLWLTYCEDWKDFFCWPCLLFAPQFLCSVLHASRKADLEEILAETNRHEITENHLICSLKLQIFISENFQLPVPIQDKVGHNFAVKKNRETFKCIIDAVCCVVGQKQFVCDGKYSCNLISFKNCKNFLQLLKDYNPRKVEVVDDAVRLLSSNPRIVNYLVDAITRSIKTTIKNEIKKSPYVSIILSQHGSNFVRSQMSTVLRYINRGKVCERFIGFTNHERIRTEEQLLNYIIKPIEEYGIAERFLGLSIDSKISCGTALSFFIDCISKKYRFSYFVPSYSHGFGWVLLESLSAKKNYGFFLKIISGIQDFFSNEKRFKSLEDLLRQKIPDYSESPGVKWNLHSNFVVYVAKYQGYFIEFFENICSSKCLENGIVAQAVAFRSFLQEFRNALLLRLFYEIFHGDFDETFNFRLDRNAFNSVRISLFRKKVKEINLVKILRALEAEKSMLLSNSEMESYEKLLASLIKHFCHEIDVRCIHLSTRLLFCNLFDALRDCPSDADFHFTEHFDRLQQQMVEERGGFFSPSELRVEMNAIKSNPDLRTKTVLELLEYFAGHNLRDLFPESYKLMEFILTLPCLPASGQSRGNSKLEDIRKFSYFPKRIGIPSGEVSFLNIECEMLRSLRQSAPFYDDVLAKFYEVNKTIPLMQI